MATKPSPALLIIDDDPDILKLMEYVFTDEGFHLIARRTPEEGLRVIRERDVDCVLIDIHFAHTPESLGFVSAMSNLPDKKHIPVLATSAMSTHEIGHRVVTMGARKFIPKPFYPTDVVSEVRSACFPAEGLRPRGLA